MGPFLRKPTPSWIESQLARLRHFPLSYWERGGTAMERMPQGFDHAEEWIYLGDGDATWVLAKAALSDWRMYPHGPWIYLSHYPKLKENEMAMVIFKLLGFWWASPVRIVYLIDHSDRFGFAYGTLEGHVEQGEELFILERKPDSGEIWFGIRMMARARHLGARALPWLTHFMQMRFRRASLDAMKDAVDQAATNELPPEWLQKRPDTLHPIASET